MSALPVMINVRHLARLTGKTPSTVRRWAREGAGPARAVRVGGDCAWNLAAVEEALGVEVRNDHELQRLLDVLNGAAPRTWNSKPISDVGRHDEMVRSKS